MTKNKSTSDDDLRQIRCNRCGRFLGYELVVYGVLQLKCPICKNFTEISVLPDKVTEALAELGIFQKV